MDTNKHIVQIKNVDKNLYFELSKKFWVTILLIAFSTFYFSGQAQEYLRVYTSAPKVMTSNVTFLGTGSIIAEDFESFTGLPDYSWAPYTSAIGNYTQTIGPSYVKNDDQYGAGTGQYMSIDNPGEVKLVFENPVRYFGFAWPAGDGQNNIKILRDGQVLATFYTSDVVSLLPKDHNNFITATNTSIYSTFDYYGKPPESTLNNGEPYAFLHYVATEGLAFDEVIFNMAAGGEFENDNHTILIGTPIIQGSWVELITIETPTANDDTESGMPGDAVEVDVLANDDDGDVNIDPTTVQIAGTNNQGSSLIVDGEGTWSVNPTTGAITFTPLDGLIGSPTPIQYFVLDDDNYASNLATVTVTYPVGPTANDDYTVTAVSIPVDINILTNDEQGSTPIIPTTVEFTGDAPNPTTEGTFSYTGAGMVTFTPIPDFTGTVTIDYQVCDQNSLCSTATITVDIVSGTSNLFPALGFGTLAFEDMWPGKGDYDFNDLVIDYQFEVNTNTSNMVESVVGTFIIRAIGASFENGFGFQLDPNIASDDITVSGSSLKESIITLNANGTESGQDNTTIIVFDNAYQEMSHPGGGIGINTEESAPYVEPVTITINIEFNTLTYSFDDLNISDFNPFIFIDKDRTVEVHLADYLPTNKANQELFGTDSDDSDPGANKYYKTANNLPWAINIYESFDYPVEKQQIVWAYLHFAEWAESVGEFFPHWYKNSTGYRNPNLIYTPPAK